MWNCALFKHIIFDSIQIDAQLCMTWTIFENIYANSRSKANQIHVRTHHHRIVWIFQSNFIFIFAVSFLLSLRASPPFFLDAQFFFFQQLHSRSFNGLFIGAWKTKNENFEWIINAWSFLLLHWVVAVCSWHVENKHEIKNQKCIVEKFKISNSNGNKMKWNVSVDFREKETECTLLNTLTHKSRSSFE